MIRKAQAVSMDLYILATSDVHGYIMPTDYLADNPHTNFGLAKAAAVINAVRKEQDHVIYIDNGDLIQGSALAQYLALNRPENGPRDIITCLNDMACDAAVIGNHEFNYGRDYLKKGIATADFPVLAANVIEQSTGKPTFQPYAIIEKDDLRIGILGLVTECVPSWEKPENIQGLYFEDPVVSAKKWVPLLKQMADIVVISYHGGFEYDPFTGEHIGLQNGENVACDIIDAVPEIDCFISGHQHRELSGSYKNIPIVMPGWRAQAVGLIHLALTRGIDGKWSVFDQEAMLLKNGKVMPNQRIVERIEPLHIEVENWLDLPIGQVKGDMTIDDPIHARSYVHPYVDFINRLQMKVAEVDLSCTSIFRGDARGLPQEITVRNIVNNYVYANTLAVLEVSGEDLRQALERCARFFAIDDKGRLVVSKEFSVPFTQYYNYDIYSGIEYTMDIRKPPGERIVTLNYHEKPVLADDRLRIVMNNYRAIGGGQYPMYHKDKIIRDIQIDMTDLMVDYIISHPIIEARSCQSFKVIY